MMHVHDYAVRVESGLEIAPPDKLLLVLGLHREVDLARLPGDGIGSLLGLRCGFLRQRWFLGPLDDLVGQLELVDVALDVVAGRAGRLRGRVGQRRRVAAQPVGRNMQLPPQLGGGPQFGALGTSRQTCE